MADLIAPNSNDPQEMAKQVEAIAEAAAQHDEQVAQLLNLVPKAAALSTVASRAISFTKKNWVDTPTSGTPITAADMNRIEQAIVDLNTTLTSVQNSLSQLLSVESTTGSINYSNGSHAMIHAPSIAGKSFVCWISAVTIEWVGSLYVLDPRNPTTEVWNASTAYSDTPGSGTMMLFALFSKSM